MDPIFTIFDLETTGLSPFNGDRIIEIAAIKVQGIELVEEFNTLVDPERKIPFESVQIHKITEEMVFDKPKIDQILPQFLDFVAGTTLIAHNAQFDLGFINHEIERLGIFHPPLEALCTVNLSRKVLPNLNRHNLDTLIEYLNIKCPQRHRALDDVKATAKVFLTIKQKANRGMLADCVVH